MIIPATKTDENPFVCVDGFLVIKGQDPFPQFDWVSLIREERINDLINQDRGIVRY